jgi:hypothetical protein
MTEVNTEYILLWINFKLCFRAKFKKIGKYYILSIWIEAKN